MMKKLLFTLCGLLVALQPITVQANESVARAVPLSGIKNMRDLGGLKTKDNKELQTGLVYRSDAWYKATTEDLTSLEGLKIRKILDLRSDIEVGRMPDRVPQGAVWAHRQLGVESVDPDAYKKSLLSGDWTSEKYRQYTVQGYKQMADEAKYILPEIVDDILSTNNGAVVYHCAGGKDRTGFISAVLLMALGVPEKSIVEDYLLTRKQRNKDYQAKMEYMQKAARVRLDPGLAEASAPNRSYIMAAINEINSNYGGIERYLSDYVGIPSYKIDALRAKLLK